MSDAYEVFGERITLESPSDAFRSLVAEHWAAFRTSVGQPTAASARFEVTLDDAPSRLTAWQFFNNGRLLVIGDDRRLVTGYFHREPWRLHVMAYRQSPDGVYYYLWEPLALMVLMRRGLVAWHGGAVARDGRAVLIAGRSGSGKSTTVLNLLTAGFGFLADDEVYLRRRDNAVLVGAPPGDLYATDATLAMFPGLRAFFAAPAVQRGSAVKRRVAVAEAFPPATAARAPTPIAVLLFPCVAPGEPTALRPLAPREVLSRCLEQRPKEYPTLVTDPVALGNQLDLYATLARSARAFDLRLGRDAESLPAQIDVLLR